MRVKYRLGHIFLGAFGYLLLTTPLLSQSYTLSGKVFSGNVGDESTPIPNVTVKLWGANVSNTPEGPAITSASTDGNGWYSLTVNTGVDAYDYYIIEETDPNGYTSVGATSVSGEKLTNNRIEYSMDDLSGTLTGNKFWDKPLTPDIEVFWNSVIIPDGWTNPVPANGTDYGPADVSGGTVDKTYTIENIGNATLTVGVSISGSSDFTVTSFPSASVPAGNTTTFTVRFDPGVTGTRTATVNITNNTSKNPYDFAVKGTGTESGGETGTIIVEKQTIPSGDAQTFTFTGDISGSIADGGQIIVSSLNPGQYTTTETVPAGWSLTGISITDENANSTHDGTATATFNLEAGETITAVFTNTKETQQEELDYGDASDPTYPTLLASNGARHTIVSNVYLGNGVDGETDGKQDANLLGDDNHGNDDEDGIGWSWSFAAGETNTLNAVASVNGYLNAWIDLNADGDWADANEQILTDRAVVTGINALDFSLPVGASPGHKRSRFRFNTSGGLSYTGLAQDGEVEDHVTVVNGVDFGDAPEPYPTLRADNGARHISNSMYYLGTNVDEELDGQPNVSALGDDGDGNDDEDGVTFASALSQGKTATVTITVPYALPSNAYLNAWVDFNGDHDWADADEHIFIDYPLLSGITSQNLTFNVPSGASVGSTYARFRIGEETGLAFVGLAHNGEVEDYQVTIASDTYEYDYGDAPAGPGYNYPDASHTPGSAWFGDVSDQPDTESGTQADADALGDDNDGNDDEDGLVDHRLIVGQGGKLSVEFYVSSPSNFRVASWIDYNHDGDWDDADEMLDWGILSAIPASMTKGTMNFSVPASALPGATLSRIRLYTDTSIAPSPGGYGGEGEVCDHKVEIITEGDPVPDPGLIHGYKWNDLDGNGTWDTGETGLPNWTIWLDANRNGVEDAGDRYEVTDGAGYFQFSRLAAGQYIVGEHQQSGWTQTYPAGPGTHTVTVDPTKPSLSISFGNKDDGSGGLGAVKWYQPPLIRDVVEQDTACYQGWRDTSIPQMPIVADDWFCYDPRPVTAVRWWGAYEGWDETDPTPNAPFRFHIGVWSHDPGGMDGEFGHPAVLLHEWLVNREDLGERAVRGIHLPGMQDAVITGFEYTYQIPSSEWFYQIGDATHYWLSVTAVYTEQPVNRAWGWLTRQHHFHDDAVRMTFSAVPQIGTEYETGEPIGNRWDMAFLLGTEVTAGTFDFGDAPPYGYATLRVNNGAYHRILPEVCMGDHVDDDADGQPDFRALGDDLSGDDDEDGVQLTETIFAGQENAMIVHTSTHGFLNAWLDVHGDGNWHEVEDHVIQDLELQPGEHMMSVYAPHDAVNGQTAFRFRFSTEENLWFNGFAVDGEVEDYMITIQSGSPVEEYPAASPARFCLHSNYPNPFNPSTRIMFELPQRADVSIHIYDLHGSHIRTVCEASYDAGTHTLTWDGTDHHGRSVATGIYLCRLTTPGFRNTIRMLYMK